MSEGINFPTLQLAKSYIDKTIEGMVGPIVGKNCTIKEITKEGKQNKVTFQWTSDSGETKEDYMYVLDGADGEDGKDGVQRVRLTADDNHIYDSDHNILTFVQVKELIMDSSKFVTLTIFDNISFLPSAYDETAIWFDAGFIEEGTPNQLRVIINDQNKVKIDQIELAEKAALVALQTFCKVSEASDNALQQKEDGLYVKKSESGEPYDDTEVRDMIDENTADILSLDGRVTNTESDISDLELATQDLTDNKVDKEENKSLVTINDISQININKNAITLLNDNDEVDGSVRNIVKRAIEGSMHLSKQFINHKPTVEEAKENILYLVPIDDDGTCEQYVLAENRIVMIGSTKVDLSNYYNKQEVDAIVDEIQLYKFPNAIIYGQPTINNGQISGFSSDNYLGLPFVFDTKDRGFEINVAFTTNSDVTTAQNIFGSKFCIALYIQNGQLVFRAGNGSDWSVADITTTLSVQANITYYVKIAFNKLNYTISYSTNGEDYESIGSKVTTIPPTVGQVNIGIGNNQHNPFNGIINLNKTFIKLNNTIVWEGMDDVGLATRLATDLENIDEVGIDRVKEIANLAETEIKMLGWSVPKECPIQNEIDSNKFVQKVGRVDLGTLDWEYNDDYVTPTFLVNKKVLNIPSNSVNCFAYGYTAKEKFWENENEDKCIGAGISYFNISNLEYTDADDFKEAVKGEYLYYELATPITMSIDGNEKIAALESSQGRNLIPYPYNNPNTYETYGITYTVNDDGSVTVNGTSTSDLVIYRLTDNRTTGEPNIVKKGVEYILSSTTPMPSNIIVGIRTYTSSKTALETFLITKNYSKIKFKITKDFAYSTIYISIDKSGVVFDNLVIYPMLEEGTIAHKYEPTVESNISLVKASTFPSGDRFYLDEKDGVKGFNTDPQRGADTFIPFKRGTLNIIERIFPDTGQYTIDTPSKAKKVIWFNTTSGTAQIIYDEDVSNSKYFYGATITYGTKDIGKGNDIEAINDNSVKIKTDKSNVKCIVLY